MPRTRTHWEDQCPSTKRRRCPAAPRNRWLQLVVGVICMVMIANLQYGWNLFVNPIDEAHHWGRAAIQVAFSLFVLTETWLIPIEGWFVDRLRTESGRHVRRRAGRHRLGHEFRRRLASHALFRGHCLGHRRRLRLRHVRRQRAQVVRRSARPRGGPHRRRASARVLRRRPFPSSSGSKPTAISRRSCGSASDRD